MLLYDYIKKLCDDRGMSISALCELSKVSTNTVYRWNDHIPTTENLKKVANVLHVPLENLKAHQVKSEKRNCAYCGQEFVVGLHRTNQRYCCEKCREQAKKLRLKNLSCLTTYQHKKEKPKADDKMTYEEKTAEAKEFNISYGIYTAIRDGYLKPRKESEWKILNRA